jgi:hypothetical protein
MSLHNTRKPLVGLISTLVLSSVPKAKLQQNFEVGNLAKIEVPKCDGTNFEGVLVTIQEFNDAASALVYETGPELFYNFRLCLFGTARDDWEIVVIRRH